MIEPHFEGHFTPIVREGTATPGRRPVPPGGTPGKEKDREISGCTKVVQFELKPIPE